MAGSDTSLKLTYHQLKEVGDDPRGQKLPLNSQRNRHNLSGQFSLVKANIRAFAPEANAQVPGTPMFLILRVTFSGLGGIAWA